MRNGYRYLKSNRWVACAVVFGYKVVLAVSQSDSALDLTNNWTKYLVSGDPDGYADMPY